MSRDRLVDLGLERVVALLARQLVERLGVLDPLDQAVEEVEVVVDRGELGR